MKHPKIAAIIVSYNGEKWIQACINSIIDNMYENLHIIMVDNNSQDNTVSIAEKHNAEITILRQKKNLGYGQGANTGIAYALSVHADYIFLLNQDIKLSKTCIMNLVKNCENNDNISIATPFQLTYDGSKTDPGFEKLVQTSKWFQHSLTGNKVSEYYEIEALIGAAVFFRADLFEKIGYFDPLFFYTMKKVIYAGGQNITALKFIS